MCLSRIDGKPKYRVAEDGMIHAWKVVNGCDNSGDCTGYDFRLGVNVAKRGSGYAHSGVGKYAPNGGFHCFLTREAARWWRSPEYCEKIVRILIDPRDVICTGHQTCCGAVVIAKRITINSFDHCR